MKVAGHWRDADRAVDRSGRVIDVVVSPRRDAKAARRLFGRAIGTAKRAPTEVVTDPAPTSPVGLEALPPAAWHPTDRSANDHVEGDHGRLKSRLRPPRGASRTAAPAW